MKKVFLFLVTGIFIMSGICLAATLDPAKIVIPKDKGRVVETFMAKAEGGNAPLIAYVQDIHVNYESQKAEAAVMEALIRDYGFDLVLVEGKRQDSAKDLKKYRANHTKRAREIAAENLLKNGSIDGIEYLDLSSDYSFTMQGIEDMSIYKKEYDDLMQIYEKDKDVTTLIRSLQNIASNLKLHIYTKEMRDLDDKIAAYSKDEIGLVEYVKFIEGAATTNNIEVKNFPNAALFIESANLENQIDFAAVETERNTTVDAVEKALTDKKAKDEFLAKGLKFRTGEIPQGEYYTYLKDIAQTAKVDISTKKNLLTYAQYITTYDKIDTTLLFKEIDQLVDNIKAAMIKTPEQKKLSQIDKGLSILSDMVNTKLVPDEYNYYIQNKAVFDLKGWLEFLKNNSVKFGLTNPIPDNVSILESNIPVLEKFYTVSFERDAAFIKNIKENLNKYGKDKAILIAGGFHTPNMKELLKKEGFSYVVIAPRVDFIRDYSGLYRNSAKVSLDYVNSIMPPAPAKNLKLPQLVSEGQLSIDAALAEADRLAAQAPEDVAVQNAKAKTIAGLKQMRDHGWLGAKLTPEQESAITAALAEPGVAQVVGLDAQTVQQIGQAITAQAQEEHLQVGQITVPQIRVIPQARMQGVRGPAVVNGNIVIGRDDFEAYGVLTHMWGHEIAAFLSTSMAMPGDEQARHRFAERVEMRMIDSNPDPSQRRVLQDIGRTSAAIGEIPQAQLQRSDVYKFMVNIATVGSPTLEPIIREQINYLRSRLGETNVELTFIRADAAQGDIVVQRRAGKDPKSAILGEAIVNVDASQARGIYGVAGLANLGFIGATIPLDLNAQNLPVYMPLIDTYRAQYAAITGGTALALPANPGPQDYVNAMRRIMISLPVREHVGFVASQVDEARFSSKAFDIKA